MSIEKFISDTKKLARENYVRIKMSKKQLLIDDNTPCAGYFDSEEKILAVGYNENLESWLSIFVHESCHMDQWIQDDFMWEKTMVGYTYFFEWLSGNKILKAEVIRECVQDIIRVERDCEERSIKKIQKYKLPIDLTVYTQRANSYLYAYLYFQKTKKWIQKIYEPEFVYTKAPKKLRYNYTSIPVRLEAAFRRQYKILNKAA